VHTKLEHYEKIQKLMDSTNTAEPCMPHKLGKKSRATHIAVRYHALDVCTRAFASVVFVDNKTSFVAKPNQNVFVVVGPKISLRAQVLHEIKKAIIV
jgi:hypothetical protein